MFEGWLSIVVFLPAAAALVIALFLRNDSHIRWFAIGATVLNLMLIVITYVDDLILCGIDQIPSLLFGPSNGNRNGSTTRWANIWEGYIRGIELTR